MCQLCVLEQLPCLHLGFLSNRTEDSLVFQIMCADAREKPQGVFWGHFFFFLRQCLLLAWNSPRLGSLTNELQEPLLPQDTAFLRSLELCLCFCLVGST